MSNIWNTMKCFLLWRQIFAKIQLCYFMLNIFHFIGLFVFCLSLFFTFEFSSFSTVRILHWSKRNPIASRFRGRKYSVDFVKMAEPEIVPQCVRLRTLLRSQGCTIAQTKSWTVLSTYCMSSIVLEYNQNVKRPRLFFYIKRTGYLRPRNWLAIGLRLDKMQTWIKYKLECKMRTVE
jgi:hypothetical protein